VHGKCTALNQEVSVAFKWCVTLLKMQHLRSSHSRRRTSATWHAEYQSTPCCLWTSQSSQTDTGVVACVTLLRQEKDRYNWVHFQGTCPSKVTVHKTIIQIFTNEKNSKAIPVQAQRVPGWGYQILRKLAYGSAKVLNTSCLYIPGNTPGDFC